MLKELSGYVEGLSEGRGLFGKKLSSKTPAILNNIFNLVNFLRFGFRGADEYGCT